MSFTRSSLTAAEREASDLNVVEARRAPGRVWRYQAQRYPDGREGPHSLIAHLWPWGVARYLTDYHKDGRERFDGFVWKAR